MNAERLCKRNVEAGRRGVRSAVALIATLGALATGLTIGGNSIQAFAQSTSSSELKEFPGCTSDMYIMRAPEPGLDWVVLNTVDVKNQFNLKPADNKPVIVYNAAGFNEQDNYIYAILQDGVGKLIRVLANGNKEDISISSPIIFPFANAGDIGPDEIMYVFHSTQNFIYRIDLSMAKANKPKAVKRATLGSPPGGRGISDVAYHEGALYGVDNQGYLTKIDVQEPWPDGEDISGSFTIGLERIGNAPVFEGFAGAFGAMFGGSNGIYGNHNDGGFYYFDVETGKAIRLAGSGETTRNDGAKCYSSPVRLPSDISISKTSYPDTDNPEPVFAPGKKTQYRVLVENHSSIGIIGVEIRDPLPPGVTDATWTCEGDESVCLPVSGTGPLNAILNVPAGPGASIAYIVEVDVPPDYTEPLVNTVTMIMPELSLQADEPPLTATVTKIPALLTVEKVGRWIDTDKSNIANAGDEIDYTFTVTNNGQVPLTDVRILDPLVTVEPTSVASLAPGEVAVFTANYVVPQEDIDNAMTTNTASAIGNMPNGGETESPPVTSEVQFPPAPEVATKKSGRFLDDLVANEFPDAGEHLEYSVTVKNSGNVTMVAYPPIDAGPTLNGKPMTGEMSAFSPDLHMIPPGEEAVFTALYALTTEDISEAAGLLDAVQNNADTPVQTLKEYREGKEAPPVPLEKPNVLTLPGYAINKEAQFPTVTRGQLVPYVITIRPVDVSGKAMLVDQLPPGFSYVPGSARVAGSPVQPRFEGRLLSIDLDVETGKDTRVEYTLAVTGAVPLGTHTNTAQVFQPGQILKPVSVRARAEVDVVPDPVFDCGDVIGSVFDDRNRNGFQDPGEVGIPHARIASLNGALTTTDAHGRFSVACADLPDARIGKTYLMKLDPRSLPTGYRILSENPRAVRLTAGKVSKLNFSVSIGRVVRLDVDDMAFLPGEAQLQPQWEGRLTNIVELLKSEPTIFRIVYKAVDTSQSIHLRRLKNITDRLSEEWKSQANDYRLEIESKILYSIE